MKNSDDILVPAVLVGLGATATVGVAMYLVGHRSGSKKSLPPDNREVRGFSVVWHDRTGPHVGTVRVRFPKGNGRKVSKILENYTPDKYSVEDLTMLLRAQGANFSAHRDGSAGYFGVYTSCGGSIADWTCKKSKQFTTKDGDSFEVWFYEDIHDAVDKVFESYHAKGFNHKTIQDLIKAGADVSPVKE